MSQAYQCDRCSTFRVGSAVAQVSVIVPQTNDDDYVKRWELCQLCARDLSRWFGVRFAGANHDLQPMSTHNERIIKTHA